MKRLMTAAIAATLMCGAAAYAQDNTAPQAPAPDASGAAAQGAPAAQGSMDQGQSGGAMNAPAPADQSSAPPPAAGDNGAMAAQPPAGGDMANGPAQTADAPAGAPPSTYPPCTSKTQDRCVQSGKMAKSGGHHMTKHRKSKKSSG